ncbi:hypothetical protein VTI74DRAFT_1122 [Chaetomium olivicolor]
MPRLSVPTPARLPSSLRVDPSTPIVSKLLSRLSRASLLSVALDWLDETNLPLAQPYLRSTLDSEDDEDDDEEGTDDFYPPARSAAALRELYVSLQQRKGSKREVLDRILEGDWRHGLTLYQLAIADLQHLYDHPTSQQWSAYRIVPLKPPRRPHDGDNEEEGDVRTEVDRESVAVPRFHPSTFLRTLAAQVLPDVKAHYNFDAHRTLGVLVLRVWVVESPYNTGAGLQGGGNGTAGMGAGMGFDTARTVYVAFPDGAPYVYISKPQTTGAAAGAGGGESKSLRALLVKGIPKALSRPLQRERFTLQSTNLVTRNLAEMVERRGGGRTNFAAGGWEVYADEKKKESPLDLVLPSPPLSDEVGAAGTGKRAVPWSAVEKKEERAEKRAKLVARARFGESAKVGDGRGVERVDVVMEDPFPRQAGVEEEDEGLEEAGEPLAMTGRRSRVDAILERTAEDDDHGQEEDEPTQGWRPYVRLTFHGSHVFAGIRQLVEKGIVDGERMPGWMTGEEGVTIGAVRNGRIRGNKGSGV